MTSSPARSLVLICAGWWFVGHAAACQAQQSEADHKLLESIESAAEKGDPGQECALGEVYFSSFLGLPQDYAKAVYWFRKAAEEDHAEGQYNLGGCYYRGQGVAKDYTESVKWCRKAADQGDAKDQCLVGLCYFKGEGAAKDYIQAYKWLNLSAGQGNEDASKALGVLENSKMTREQIAEGQRLSREFKPRQTPGSDEVFPRPDISAPRREVSGTGFFISEDGYLVTNAHVVKDASQVRL